MNECSVENCFNKVCAKNLCQRHYDQIRYYGKILSRTIYDPNEIIIHNNYAEIILYNNKNIEIERTLIDLDDIEKVKGYKWNYDKSTGYVQSRINKKVKCLHELICDFDLIDHKNRDKLDNRKENLRPATHSQNKYNISIPKNNKTGIIGVCFKTRQDKYVARLKLNYKEIHLGTYGDIEDAIKTRLQAEKKYFGEFAPQQHLFKEYGIE